jgi:hypothetical protein
MRPKPLTGACRIGDKRADFSRIWILDDFDPMHRRDAEIDERFGR